MSSVLSCKSLSKTYSKSFKKVEALKGVDFEIPRGAVCGLLGPNGSGKSTLIKILMGFLKHNSGEFQFFGGLAPRLARSRISYVPEKASYPSVFSGLDIMKIQAKLSEAPLDKIDHYVQLVQMEGAIKRSFGGYSKGMRQRLAIAQALISEPDLLILDEPLSGLDPDGRELLISIIESYAQQKDKTVLMSSHLLDDVQRVCNHLVVLKEGHLVFTGEPSELFNPKTFKLQYKKEGRLESVKLAKEKLHGEIQRYIEEGCEIFSVEPEREAISEIYFKYTHQGESSHESHS